MPGAYDANKKQFNYQITFTANGSSPFIDISNRSLRSYAIQVKGVGAGATAWTVNVEGSNNGVNVTTLGSHGTADVDGTLKQIAGPVASKFVRLTLSGLTLAPATGLAVFLCGVE